MSYGVLLAMTLKKCDMQKYKIILHLVIKFWKYIINYL